MLDPIVLRTKGPDALLIPDVLWGGTVERTRDPDVSAVPTSLAGLPRPNVVVTSDEPAWFAAGESSIEVKDKPEWIEVRAGHAAFVLVAPSVTILGAVDVPGANAGYTEVHFTPKARSLRIVVHTP